RAPSRFPKDPAPMSICGMRVRDSGSGSHVPVFVRRQRPTSSVPWKGHHSAPEVLQVAPRGVGSAVETLTRLSAVIARVRAAAAAVYEETFETRVYSTVPLVYSIRSVRQSSVSGA